jgi:hypothetical protein
LLFFIKEFNFISVLGEESVFTSLARAVQAEMIAAKVVPSIPERAAPLEKQLAFVYRQELGVRYQLNTSLVNLPTPQNSHKK